MGIFSKLSYKWFRLKQSVLYRLLKTQIIGPDVDNFQIDPNKPVIFATLYPSEAEQMVIDIEAAKLGWPRPSLLQQKFSKLKYSFFAIYRHSNNPFQRDPISIVDKQLVNNGEWCLEHEDNDIQIIPTRVFWGRAPEKERSFFKIWLQNSGTLGGRLSTLFAILFNGRNTYVHFSRPLSLNDLVGKNSDAERLSRKVSRILRVHNRQVSASVLGPDLSHRRTLVHQLPNRPIVRQAIKDEIEATGKSQAKIKTKARKYADEIASNISYTNIRFLDIVLTWVWNKIYAGISLHNITQLKDISKDNTIIYVPCHRSHIDYLLLSYVLYHQGLQLPHIAAGINLNIPIVGSILRRGGAFFMRRSFKGNQLYGAVFDEYLHSIFTHGYASEYFIEGGRSRTGRTLQPKSGMLAMTVRSYLRDQRKPVIFVPVYTGYEKVFEANSYLGELRGQAKRKESLFGVLGTLRSLKNSFGRVHVTFGDPIELDDFLTSEQPDWQQRDCSENHYRPEWANPIVANLADKIITGINNAASLNSINLLSLALLPSPRQSMDENQLMIHMSKYYDLMSEHPYSNLTAVPDTQPAQWLQHGIDLKLVSRNIHPLGDIIQTDERQAVTMTYYRNNVLHLFALPSLISCLFINNRRFKRREVKEIVHQLYPYIQAELFLRWQPQELDKEIDQWLTIMIDKGYLISNRQGIHITPSSSDEYIFMMSMAKQMMPAFERYYIALSLINSQQVSGITALELEQQCTLQAQRVSLLVGINAPEFFDKALFRQMIQTMLQQQVVEANEDEQLIAKSSLTSLADTLDNMIPAQLRQLIHDREQEDEDEEESVSSPLNNEQNIDTNEAPLDQ